MTSFERRLPFGATLIDDRRTQFRLWAPAQEKVSVEIEGCAPVPMQRLADGWFDAEAACGAGRRYRYRLKTDLAVPDPASRAQAGDVHGPSLVVDPHAYRWRNTEWRGRPWEETVLYELHAGLLGHQRRQVVLHHAARIPDLRERAALGRPCGGQLVA